MDVYKEGYKGRERGKRGEGERGQQRRERKKGEMFCSIVDSVWY
jgi:hypothetical protein